MESNNESRDVFVAKTDPDGNINWAFKFGGPGNDISYGISLDKLGNIYVFGAFTQKAYFGHLTLQTQKISNSDIFLLKLNKNGNVLWVQKAGLDTLKTQQNITFLSRFNRSGNHLKNSIYFDEIGSNEFGITFGENDEVVITGAFNAIAGFKLNKPKITTDMEKLHFSDFVIQENKRLISLNYEKTIAGLFSVLNYINTNGNNLSGQQAQEVLDKNNPHFKISSPKIYNNIGRIKFIQNADGIVELRTQDKKPVSFELMKIKTNSRIKVVNLPGNDARLDILNGINVGKSFIWYTLNNITMLSTSGDLLFDYDSDHTQKKFNLAKDILE